MFEYRELLKLPIGISLLLFAVWAAANVSAHNTAPFQFLIFCSGVLGVSIIASFFKIQSILIKLLNTLQDFFKRRR